MGKSALGALHGREPRRPRTSIPVALFTLEMSKSEVTQRLMCSEAKVESQRLRTGKLAAGRLAAPDRRLRQAREGADLRRRHRLDHDDGDPLEGAAAEVARAEPRADHRRLPAADDVRHDRREPRAGGLADLALAEGARARPRRADPRASRSSRARSSSATTSGRSSPTCASRARSSRTPTSSSSSTATSTTTTESDQQGLAEVNLAKHRNGPTGHGEALVPEALREVRRSGAPGDQEEQTDEHIRSSGSAPTRPTFAVPCEACRERPRAGASLGRPSSRARCAPRPTSASSTCWRGHRIRVRRIGRGAGARCEPRCSVAASRRAAAQAHCRPCLRP